jgi:predicted phage terminase large subunit-like protein
MHTRRAGDVLSPAREPREILDALRRQIGSDSFYAQYQQSPVPPGGAMIKRLWIQRCKDPPPRERDGMILQSWDTAARGGADNDYSVCTTWYCADDCRLYLLDLWRGRVDYPTLKAKVVELARLWSADQVLIEEAGTALAVVDELRFEVMGLTGVKPEKDKVARMAIASARFEAGQILFPEHAAWMPELEAELFAFPGGKHDDQVDSISQAILNEKMSQLRIFRALAE